MSRTDCIEVQCPQCGHEQEMRREIRARFTAAVGLKRRTIPDIPTLEHLQRPHIVFDLNARDSTPSLPEFYLLYLSWIPRASL